MDRVLNKGAFVYSQVEGQDSPRQALRHNYINKSNEKQVIETVSTWSQNWLLLCNSAEKAMATHSSTLAWRIPGTMEPGELLSMGSHRVGHD